MFFLLYNYEKSCVSSELVEQQGDENGYNGSSVYLWWRIINITARRIMGIPSEIKAITRGSSLYVGRSIAACTHTHTYIHTHGDELFHWRLQLEVVRVKTGTSRRSDRSIWENKKLTDCGAPLAPVGAPVAAGRYLRPHPHPVGWSGSVWHYVLQLSWKDSRFFLFWKDYFSFQLVDSGWVILWLVCHLHWCEKVFASLTDFSVCCTTSDQFKQWKTTQIYKECRF